MEAAPVVPGSAGTSPVSDLGEIHKLLDPTRIREYITEQTVTLKVRTSEKKEFGEVFTPVNLINKMLNNLPKHVWKNKDLKWLDPAAGIGNFPMVVYERLMRGLAPVFPDPSERSEHIIRNMLYMVELNGSSCVKIALTFGTAANLIHGSIIKTDTRDKDPIIRFNDPTISTFDVIVGNPPYNAPKTGKGGSSTLWNKFVDESLDKWLKPNGYLTFVHPSGWRKPPSARSKITHMFDNMVHKNYMSYLEIHSKCDGVATFRAHTRYEFYVIQKRPPTSGERTTVVDQKGITNTLDLREWGDFLPNHSFELIKSLFAPTKQDYVIYSRCQYGTDTKNEEGKLVVKQESPSEEFPYPLIHSIVKSGLRMYSTNVKKNSPEMFGVSKIVMAESGIRNGVYPDPDGDVGMTQGAFGIKLPAPIDEETPLMIHALESELFADIVDAMSYENFRVDRNMFRYFRRNFYKDPEFQESPKISTISESEYTKCDDDGGGGEGEGEGEGEDEGEDECEDEGGGGGGGGGAAAMPRAEMPQYTKTLSARPAPPPLTARPAPTTPLSARKKPRGKAGGRTRRRRRHRTTSKLRKYKKQRHTRKKHRFY